MSVHFILGGSGRGKSYYMNHMVVKRARMEPKRAFIVVVPEQFTMQTQKELISISESKGIMNIEVQSFVRLAYRIFGETGAGNIPVLDDMGKTMVLRKVLANEKENLGYFGKNIHKRGYIEEIKSFLSELLQYEIDTEQMEEMIHTAKKKPILQKKLQDMEITYRAFLEYLEDHYITSEEVLSVLCDVVQDSKILQDSVICLDGFTGFTPIQYRLIEKLLCCCKECYITVTIDSREELLRVGPSHRLFYMSRKTIKKIRELAEKCQIEVGPEIWTENRGEQSRFACAPGLDSLERNLFRYSADRYAGIPEDISIHSLKQPEHEVNFVIQKILWLRENSNCRYRDIAVITGDMEIYGTLAREAFEKANLPYFIDQKKSILIHPFIRMIRSLVDIIRKGFAYTDCMNYLRGRYCSIPSDQIDLLDNFLLASGIRGYKRWKQEWDCSKLLRLKTPEEAEKVNRQLNQTRIQVLEMLDPLYLQIGRRKHTVREYAECFCRFLEEQEFCLAIRQNAQEFRDQGMLAQAKEYEQVYEIVLGVFERLVELLGDEVITLEEFRELLETGFSEARVGLIPPGVDQVLVGDISRTRLDHVKYLFFLGLNDCNIPAGSGGGGILSEAERNFLTEAEYELAPTARETIYTEQFYLYLNLTKPERHLYLCYCETGNDGRARNPAYLVDRIGKQFPELQVTVEETCDDAEHILAADRGKKYMIRGLRIGDYSDYRWKEIYRYYRFDSGDPSVVEKLVQAAFYKEPVSQISRAAARALYQDILYGSASQLERYASCAFAYFMRYGLRLSEREERQVEFFDIGNIIHEALELYTEQLLTQGKRWQDLAQEEQHIQANQCLNQAVEEYKNGLLYDTERDTYLITRLRRILQRTVWAITSQMNQGEFRTVESELSFKNLYGPVNLAGRIDRVDKASKENVDYITIVDYKTGQKDISMSDLYYGLQMQLVIYLKAVVDKERENTEGERIVVPAGVLYYNIDDPVLEGKIPEDKREKALLASLKMRGLVNEDDPVLPSLDSGFYTESGELPLSTDSHIAPFATDRNGELKKNSSVITTKDFEWIMEFTKGKIESMGEEILSGKTEINPYRKLDSSKTCACDYCPYHGICRFDTRLEGHHYRLLKKMSSDDAYRAIAEKIQPDVMEPPSVE